MGCSARAWTARSARRRDRRGGARRGGPGGAPARRRPRLHPLRRRQPRGVGPDVDGRQLRAEGSRRSLQPGRAGPRADGGDGPRRRRRARAGGGRPRRQRRLRGSRPLDVGAPGRSDRADLRLDRRPAHSWPTEVHVTHHRTVIVGTGFSGIGMAIKLLREGERDFVLLERADENGGTWRDNTYPGCRCDVPSHLYSFSFAPNPDWSSTFSPQPEILEYLKDCSVRFGVMPHIRFETELETAAWDDEEKLWRIETSNGAVTADILIAAQGPLSDPS